MLHYRARRKILSYFDDFCLHLAIDFIKSFLTMGRFFSQGTLILSLDLISEELNMIICIVQQKFIML